MTREEREAEIRELQPLGVEGGLLIAYVLY
jgi:hypothetical protein